MQRIVGSKPGKKRKGIMNAALWVRFLIFTPMFMYAGIYCWRHGIRWTKTTNIRGIPAKIAAVLLFSVPLVMFLSVLFPRQAGEIMDRIDKSTASPNAKPRE